MSKVGLSSLCLMMLLVLALNVEAKDDPEDIVMDYNPIDDPNCLRKGRKNCHPQIASPPYSMPCTKGKNCNSETGKHGSYGRDDDAGDDSTVDLLENANTPAEYESFDERVVVLGH